MTQTKVSTNYAREFADKHTEVGELKRGDKVSGESLSVLGNLLSDMARSIERKSLEHQGSGTTMLERVFVRTAADMLTRTLTVAAQDSPSRLRDPAVIKAADKVIRAGYGSGTTERRARIEELSARGPQIQAAQIEAVTAVVHDTDLEPESFKVHSSNLTDIVEGSADALKAIAFSEGGFRITTYLEGNLQNMLAHYEQVEAERAIS